LESSGVTKTFSRRNLFSLFGIGAAAAAMPVVAVESIKAVSIVDPGHTHLILPRFTPGMIISSDTFNKAFEDLENVIKQLQSK
jgi:hypothetical protein